MDKFTTDAAKKEILLDILSEIDNHIEELYREPANEIEALYDLKTILRKKYWEILHGV